MSKRSKLQEDIVNEVLKFYSDNDKGYLDLAMRVGKTRIAIETLKRMYKNGNILVAYPDNKLKENWEKECIKWGYTNPNLKYTNFSSLKKYLDEDFDMFICDEFHNLSENEGNLASQISGQHLFLSGTISSSTEQKWRNYIMIYQYSTEEGIIDGILADYNITVHIVSLDTKVQTVNKQGKLLTEKQKYNNYTYVIENMKYRGANFMHLALARNRLSLSSIGKMNYLKSLLNKLKDKRVLVFTGLAEVADNVGIPSFHSKSKDKKGFDDFLNGMTNHLALAAMGKMGVKYPFLNSVILLNFTYNKEDTSQILNRAINLDYVDKVADLHIICLNEPAEMKKVKESLSMLDQNKIKYV